MPLKINISDKGKTYKVELEQGEGLFDKSIGDKIAGKDVKPELEGYELEISGGSDKSGFPMKEDIEGIGINRVLLSKGWGMKDSRKGIRLRKTVRGKTVGEATVQVNMIVVKEGSKKLEDIFTSSDGETSAGEASEEPKAEDKAEEQKEAPKEEVKEEKKEETKSDDQEKKEEPKSEEAPESA